MASLEAGRLLANRFLLQERLGDGGHAEVWAARDQQGDGRVALKFLHLRSCTADEALPILRHEAQMAQRLDHPGVLRVADPERDGQLVFLPIEYAAGGDAARLRGAPWQHVLPVLLAVARVLEHAHSRGVVHRDIKPGNVLFDTAGRVRLTDFGTSARTGCCDALAAGSPFSASPQQLRGEPATTADDVYGLGALAYELLTRYPPFYPHFDAARVQAEDPVPPVPAHPAPVVLTDLVCAMLARDARQRPDLAQVMQVFDECLAAAGAAAGGSAIVVEASVPQAAARPARRRWPGAGWWLAAAAVAGGVLLFQLPSPDVTPGSVDSIATSAPVTRVADAIVTAPTAAQAPAQAVPVVAVALPTVADELAAARAALDAGQPAQARAAFLRAQALDAANADAAEGLTAAARLDAALRQLAAGTRAEAQGDLAGAAREYQAVLNAQAGFEPARAALSRVQAQQRAQQFETVLAAAADALRRGRIDEAQAGYTRAAALYPDEPRVQDGRQRVAEVLRSQRNAQDLAAGAALESDEKWDEALAHYRAVLARDASLRFAQDGQARSERRIALDRELRDYLARPERLTAAAVRAAAERALARGEASASQAPRLQQQLQQLRGVLQALVVQVRVALTSDNSTRVTVAQLGELGSFVSRELQLPPGHYTIIGRRDGFRDVRYELNIAPGQRDTALSVQCTERI